MLGRYAELKAQLPQGTILFYQVGTFFETFEESTRRNAVSAAVKIVRGAPDAQLRGTIQCALEVLPELMRPRRTLCA